MTLLDRYARTALLVRARSAIAHAIGVRPDVATPDAESALHLSPIPEMKAGAFVTLRIRGALRGCIGYPEAELLLVDVIERCAVSAALSDPRFPPLRPDEWSDVDVELSILGPIEQVGDIAEVTVGRHGLIVEFGRRRGLLLPQVAIEWKWSAAEFAAQTCLKAGLPGDAWQKGATLFKFEAEVFGETRNEERNA